MCVFAVMGQQLRRAVGKIKEVERSSPSRVSIDRRSLPTEELSAVKSSPSTAAVDGVSGINPKSLAFGYSKVFTVINI